jgi:hypothetical protein
MGVWVQKRKWSKNYREILKNDLPFKKRREDPFLCALRVFLLRYSAPPSRPEAGV